MSTIFLKIVWLHINFQKTCSAITIFLPSWSSSSTQPVSMLNLQALSSYFIFASSKSCYRLTVYDKVSEFCAVHGNLRCCTRRKRKIRTLLQSETGSDFSCLVGAGGLREPRRIRSPGRGSQRLHRALGGTRILLAAAPTAPPCFCRRQRSSLLLFESTRICESHAQTKQKTPAY